MTLSAATEAAGSGVLGRVRELTVSINDHNENHKVNQPVISRRSVNGHVRGKPAIDRFRDRRMRYTPNVRVSHVP